MFAKQFLYPCVALLCFGCGAHRTEDIEAVLRLKQKCRDAGTHTRSEWVSRYPGERFSDEPEYAYNAELNTCLYADSYSDNNNPLAQLAGATTVDVRFVLDVFANKTLVEYTAYDGKPIEGSPTEAQFNAEKRRLMRQ